LERAALTEEIQRRAGDAVLVEVARAVRVPAALGEPLTGATPQRPLVKVAEGGV
jgi:hypothetical protein